MIVGVIALAIILLLKNNGQLKLLSQDIIDIWIADEETRSTMQNASMPLSPFLLQLFGGFVAAAATWVCLDVRSIAKQLAIFAVAIVVILTAPAVWLRAEFLFDSAPMVVGLIVGVVGGQIAAGVTWNDAQRARFREMMQNRCEDWVCERLAEHGSLTSGEEFPAVVVAIRARGEDILPDQLHYTLQQQLKQSGAIVDDTQLQDLIGVFPTVHSPSEVARLALDAINLAKETCAEFAANNAENSDAPDAYCVIARFGGMSVRPIRRLTGQRDVAVSGPALRSAMEWLFAHRPWAGPDEKWSVTIDNEFSSIDPQIAAVRTQIGEIGGTPCFTVTGKPAAVPVATVVAPTAKAKARVVKSTQRPEVDDEVEEKVVNVKPRRVRLKVESPADSDE